MDNEIDELIELRPVGWMDGDDELHKCYLAAKGSSDGDEPSAVYSEEAMRVMQARIRELESDKERHYNALCMAKECMTVIYSDKGGDYYKDENLSADIDAIDAALEQEDEK